jgi:hypothetical protein
MTGLKESEALRHLKGHVGCACFVPWPFLGWHSTGVIRRGSRRAVVKQPANLFNVEGDTRKSMLMGLYNLLPPTLRIFQCRKTCDGSKNRLRLCLVILFEDSKLWGHRQWFLRNLVIRVDSTSTARVF